MKYKMKLQARFSFRLLLPVALLLLVLPTIAQIPPPKDIPEGYSLIDGDILMPTAFVNAVLNKNQSPDAPEATYRTNLWTNAIVRFEFDTNVTAANQTNMINAMAVLENVANVDFQQCAANNCNGSGNYVHVQNSTGNNSQVGMIGGQQVINIVSWTTQFTIVHELLHCLGFFHEHIRPDRNTFVQINCGNVQGGCSGTTFNSNFVIPGDASIFGNYDFDSVMHYGQCSFSIDCPVGAGCNCTNNVITVLPPNNTQWQTAIGQRTHLSTLDRATLSYLYPPNNWVFYDCTYNTVPQSGSFLQPYSLPSTAMNNTPVGGTLVVLKNCSFPVATYTRQINVITAPGVTARFGN